jgi:hypothetical protein
MTKQTGSLQNHLYGRMVIGQPEPEVGMGATLLGYTDRHAATVIAWVAKTQVVSVQHDHAKRIDDNGMSESQTYEYSPDPRGHIEHFRRAKDGRWYQVRWNPETKRWNKTGGVGLRLGERRAYHDFSF